MSTSQDSVDELFDVKNAFYTGNYQTCINEAGKLKVCQLLILMSFDLDLNRYYFLKFSSHKVADPSMSLERDILVYRAYLALRKWRVVLEEVSGTIE